MSKFKVGDKVRCIGKSCAFGVEVGSIYTVKNPRLFESQVHEGVYCMELLEVGSSPYDKHFELVQPKPKFKVGDKIRCVDNSRYPRHLTVGKVYTVLKEDTDPRYVCINPDHNLDDGSYRVDRFELVQEDAVLAPEEVFEHLRKGTKLQYSAKGCANWCDHSGTLNRIRVNELLDYEWRIKPEPEVIELNGKKYIEIME